jgi:hypothetical protein
MASPRRRRYGSGQRYIAAIEGGGDGWRAGNTTPLSSYSSSSLGPWIAGIGDHLPEQPARKRKCERITLSFCFWRF